MYHSRKNSPLCHFRANACGVPSNPKGASAGGISALVLGIITERLSPANRVRSRTLQSPCTSQSDKKTSPKSTRKKQSEPNLRNAKAGALGGSSREVREVWRVGTPLRKRGSCASKVFLTLPLIQTFIGRSRVRSWIASAMCGARITSLESRSAIVRATRRMRPYPRALNPMRSYAARSRADASSST